MEWVIVIVFFLSVLIGLVIFGVPVAFAFFFTNVVTSIYYIGLDAGMANLIHSSYRSLATFTLTPIPFFVFMGQILFHSGLVMRVLDAFSTVLGKIQARLSVLALGTGTLLSAMSGSAVADTATLGSTLAPEMRRRGYHLKMIVGPIVAAGSFALIIPPSTTAILLGSYARISVGDLLVGGIIPGLLLSVVTIFYYIGLGYMKPELAPIYDTHQYSTMDKIKAIMFNAVPVSMLIVVVLGFIFSGIVTTTESAAVGAMGAIVLAVLYRRISIDVLLKSFLGTLKVTSMILLIIAAAAGFSQLLAFTGASRGLVNSILSLEIAPIVTIILMIIIVLILGTFIDPISIMMITIPLYMPIVIALEFDVVWFGILMLISMGLGNITPPFGLLLFVIKGVLPDHVKISEIYRSIISVVIIQVIVIVVLIIFPIIVTFLPYLGR